MENSKLIEVRGDRNVEKSNPMESFQQIVALGKTLPKDAMPDCETAISCLTIVAYYSLQDDIKKWIRDDTESRHLFIMCMAKCVHVALKPIIHRISTVPFEPFTQAEKKLYEEAVLYIYAATTNYLSTIDEESLITDDALTAYKSLFACYSDFANVWVVKGKNNWVFGMEFGYLLNFTRNLDQCTKYIQSGDFNMVNYLNDSTIIHPSASNLSELLQLILNTTRCKEGRRQIMETGHHEKIAWCIKQDFSVIERTVAISIMKNLALDEDTHERLVDSKADTLSLVLLPVVGDGTYSTSELVELPELVHSRLHYDDKPLRDPVPQIRLKTLELIYRLCSKKTTRESLRSQGVYYLLREYHLVEEDESLLELTEKVVNLLIQTEEEIGAENLLELRGISAESESSTVGWEELNI